VQATLQARVLQCFEPGQQALEAGADADAGEGDQQADAPTEPAVAEDGAMVVRALDRLTESLRG